MGTCLNSARANRHRKCVQVRSAAPCRSLKTITGPGQQHESVQMIYNYSRDSPGSAMRGSVLLVFSAKSCFLKITNRLRVASGGATSCSNSQVAQLFFPPSSRKCWTKIPQRQEDAKLRAGPPARCPRRSSGRMAREHRGVILRDKTHPYVK